MHKTSVRIEYGEIDSSYPGPLEDVDQVLVNYVSFRQGTYKSYRNAHNDDISAFPEIMSKAAHYVKRELPTNVLRTRDDYPSIMELATR